MFELLPLNISLSLGLAVSCFAFAKIIETVIAEFKKDVYIKIILAISTVFYAGAALFSIIFIINLLYLIGMLWGIE